MKKLVRDLIPDIIPEDKKSLYKFSIANDDDYKLLLREKLIEEINEFLEAENEEEFADVLEVLDTWKIYKNLDSAQIDQIKIKKKIERGGFENKILLEVVKND